MSSKSVLSDEFSQLSISIDETENVPLTIGVEKKKAAANPKSSSGGEEKSGGRFHWPLMELRVVKDAHGSKHDSYPFLSDSNEQDKALARNLLVYRPFLQKKGEQTISF
jgi:hypothetical protein